MLRTVIGLQGVGVMVFIKMLGWSLLLLVYVFLQIYKMGQSEIVICGIFCL